MKSLTSSCDKRRTALNFIFIFMLYLFLSPWVQAAESEAKELLIQMDQILRGNAHQMTVTMNVVTPRWKRDYKIKVWMKGVDFALARVIEPSKVEGQGFLRVESRLWNYLPSAERTMLIPPSLMLDRFLGSDFSNDDFVKLTYFPRDYDSKILETSDLNGALSYHLELLPHPEAPVTYGKLEIWIRKEDHMPLRWDFYNDRLKLIRTLEYSEFHSFGSHLAPTVWTMKNLEKEGHQTVIRILEAQYDVELSNLLFKKENLEKYP